MRLYMLSTEKIDIKGDVEGVAVDFLLRENDSSNQSTFYFALLLCEQIDQAPKNERLIELLHNVAMEVDISHINDLDKFLQDNLINRQQSDTEKWTCFAFKRDSPLEHYTSSEVKVFTGDIPSPSETEILAIAVGSDKENGIYRPTSLQLIKSGANKCKATHSWYSDKYSLKDNSDKGEFAFVTSTQQGLVAVSLHLPYVWRLASNGVRDRMSLSIALARSDATASRISLNGQPAKPQGDFLSLRTDSDRERLGRFEYHVGNEFRLSMKTDAFSIQWDVANALEVGFEGSNLEWRISNTGMGLWAVDTQPFTLKPALTFVSSLVDEFNVVHPAVKVNNGEPVKPLSVSVEVNTKSAKTQLLATGLDWPGNGKPPEWIVGDNDLTIPSSQSNKLAKKSRLHDPAEKARFTTLDSDINGLLGTTVEKAINGEFVGLGATLADLATGEQKLSSFVMDLECSLTKGGSKDLVVQVKFNLLEMKLADEDMYFRFLRDEENPGLDFGLFLIEKPEWPDGVKLGEINHDGTINVNVANGKLVVAPKRDGGSLGKPVRMFVPGGQGFEKLAERADYEKKRWLLHLQERGNGELLKIARPGVSVKAKLQPKPITLLEDKDLQDNEKLFRSIEADPVVEGFIDIKDNQILSGELQAKMLLPGTSDLRATAFARLAQDPSGTARFSAELRIDSESSRPVCELLIGFFSAQFSRPRLGLAWVSRNGGKWSVRAIVDAELAIRSNVELQNGMTELHSFNSIVVKDLDLVRLTYKEGTKTSSFQLSTRKFSFSVFGLVGLQLDRVAISWEENNHVTVTSDEATITFGSVGQTRGGISLGQLVLECGSGRVKIKSISGAGVSLSVPGKFDFHGGVSWKDELDEQYFAISGRLTTFGGLSVEGLLKYGSARKLNGDSVPYLAAFASRGNLNRVLSVLPPIVFQEGGIGAGYNAELGNLSRNPSVEEILEKIDSLEPSNEKNWRPVRDNGTYVNVVGKVIFTSQIALQNTICGYVLSLVASVDSTGRVIAAGKVWLFSSQRFAKENNRRPSLVAAMRVDLRRPEITIRAETRKGGAIEAFPQLKEILDRTDALLTVRLTPELFDIFLQRLTYRQQWLGGDFDFSSSWRFSIFRETVLHYVRASVLGQWGAKLGGEHGGFEFGANVDAGLEYGGLVGRLGVMTWGRLSASISASCCAYVEVEFSVPYVKWKGVKSSVEYRTVSKRYEMPTQSISLGVSGEYAFRGTGGISAGARLQVHFDRHFCGQNLSISPEYTFNADVVDDVKNRVRNFETQLDRVANQRSIALRGIQAKQNEQRRKLLESIRSDQGDQNDTEEWIALEFSDADAPNWALVPTYSTPWLTNGRQEGEPNSLFAWQFKNSVEKIEVGIESIVPVWNHEKWENKPTEDTVETGDHQFLQLNSLFAESAVEVDKPTADKPTGQGLSVDSEKADRKAWKQMSSEEGPVEDLRPLRQLRDALVDEDRLSLPSQVYPFTFRPQSGGDYEDLSRLASESRLGSARLKLGVADYRSARGSIIAMLIEEMSSRIKNGVFSAHGYRGTTSFIQSDQFPIGTQVKVTRTGQSLGTSVRVLRLALESSHRAPNDNFVVDVRELSRRIKTFRGCQEFRIPNDSTDSGATSTPDKNPQVVIKLPISFRELFDPIKISSGKSSSDVPLNTKWFELVSHVQIKRRMPFEKEFQKIGDRIPLPAEVVSGQVLLHPFIFTDSISVPTESRSSRDRFMEAIEYQLVVVPIGWENREERDFVQLTRSFPSVEPFIPGTFELKGDLGIVFIFEKKEKVRHSGNKLAARLIHTTSSSENSEIVLDNELELADFEIWTESRELDQDGFYGRTVKPNDVVATDDEVSSRESRISREASGQELRSTIGLTQQAGLKIENETLIFPGAQFDSSKAYRFFIRASGSSPIAPVRELPVFLARNNSHEELIRPMSVADLEIVESTTIEHPTNFEIAPVEASDVDPRHRLLIQWDHPIDPKVAGVELEILDYQEDRKLLEHQIEVLTESLFRDHVRNFGDESEWLKIGQLDGLRKGWLNDDVRKRKEIAPTVEFKNWFWDAERWFHGPNLVDDCNNVTENKNCEVVSAGYCKLKAVHAELKKFKCNQEPNHFELASAVKGLWDVIPLFLKDSQNDGVVATSAIEELRCGLIAQFSGLFPIGSKSFRDLELEYAEQRRSILRRSLSSVTGSFSDETYDKRMDLLAARQLIRLVEYRRLYALKAIDDGDSFALLKTDYDILANGEGLPENEQEKSIFRDWLGIKTPPEASTVKARFPISSWFFDRMIPTDITPKEWGDFHSGQTTAKKLLQTISEQFARICSASEGKSKWRTVPFVVELQKIIRKTGELLNTPEEHLVPRSHHALGNALDDQLDKIPVSTPLESLLPESIRNGDDAKTAASTLFPSFLHLLERLGFAVDVALMDQNKGIQSQDALKKFLNDRIPANDKWHFAVVYGRAMDDGSAASTETKFPFAKVLVIPEVIFNNGNSKGQYHQDKDTWRSFLEDRSVTFPDDENGKRLRELALNWWSESINLVQREIHLEHRGGSVITIPVLDSRKCRIQLPVPALHGQRTRARIRSLSRYQYIEDWLKNGGTAVTNQENIPVSEPVDLRPYYSQKPPGPAVPFGVANNTRIDFIISHPADEVDSRDNLLTATRTGFKHLGLTFIHQPVDLDKLSELSIDKTDNEATQIGRENLKLTDREISCFSNESVIGISHLPYYMEVALLARSIYDAVGKNASDAEREGLTFMRRRPSQIGAGKIKVLDVDSKTYIQFSLVRHDDLLSDDERTFLPNEWSIQGRDLRWLPDIRTSYLLLYRAAASSTLDDGSNDENRLLPLFQVLLPACPGYGTETTDLKAKVQVISKEFAVEPGPYPFRENDNRFVVEVPVDLKDFNPEELYVATLREGQIAISPITPN